MAEKELEHITDTPLNSRNIVINKDSLPGGNNYYLALIIKTSYGQTGMSVYDISAASLPTGEHILLLCWVKTLLRLF